MMPMRYTLPHQYYIPTIQLLYIVYSPYSAYNTLQEVD